MEARISSALRQVLSSTVAQRQSRTRAQAPPAPSRQRPRVVADPVFDPRSVVMAAIAAAKHGGQAAHVVVPSSSSSSVATTPRVAHRAAGGTAGATGSSFRDKAWERQADAGNRPPHGAPTPGTEAWSARDGVSGDDGGGHGRGVDVEHGKTGPAPARFEGEPSGSGTADAAVEAPRAARRRLQTAMDKALTGMDRFKHPSAADRPLEGATEQDSDQARAMGVSRDWGASPPAGDARVSDRAALNAGSGPLAPGRSVQRRPERGGEGGKAFVQWLCTGELEGDADPAMEVVIRVLEAASGGNRTDPGALDAAGAELATAALLAVEGLQRGEGATTGSEGTGRAVDSESSCTNVDSEGTGSALERVEAVAEALRGLGSAPRLAALTMWCHGSCRESAGFERVGRDCGGNS